MTKYPPQYVQCIQENKQLSFNHYLCYQSRGISVEKMVRDCVSKYNIENDFNFIVSTNDLPKGESDEIPVFYYCNSTNLENLFPDFTYESWPEIGINDFTTVLEQLRNNTTLPQFNKIGWIGTLLCEKRKKVYNLFKDTDFTEIIPITWVKKSPAKLTNNSYMTYLDQCNRWKYQLDIEGGNTGWSARLKTQLTMPRITFVVDRVNKDWCWHFIKPWVHYVPVKDDLSDLEENYHKIESDSALQQSILYEKSKVYDECLTYDSALRQIYKLLQTTYNV